MSTAKSYSISKLTVWEAYQRVKANLGAAGIDEQSIAQFEQKLQRPPVRQVEIPKQSVDHYICHVRLAGVGRSSRSRMTGAGPDCVKTQQAMAINCRGIFSASRRPPEAQSGAFGDSGCYGTLGFGAPAGGR